jgi:SAM-dependent methyltransferase
LGAIADSHYRILAMPEEVALEPSRFAAAARYYLAGRPAYAQRLIRRIVKELHLGVEDAVLDLGCGPAQLAMLFAPFVGSVLAIDPSADMLAIGRLAARATGNIRFKSGSSFEIGPELGTFKLVTIGRAFHWMDRPNTLRRLDAMVERGGAVALFADSHPRHRANAWVESYRRIIEEYAADDVQRGRRRSADWPSNEEILLASPFAWLERWSVVENRSFPAAQLVERALSMSSINETRLGTRMKPLIDDINKLASQSSHEGTLHEVIESCALVARRPCERELRAT